MILAESTATVATSISRFQRLQSLWTLPWGVAPAITFRALALRAFTQPPQLPVLMLSYCLDRITGYFLTAFQAESLIKTHRCLWR
jgi:hypothetical protein